MYSLNTTIASSLFGIKIPIGGQILTLSRDAPFVGALFPGVNHAPEHGTTPIALPLPVVQQLNGAITQFL